MVFFFSLSHFVQQIQTYDAILIMATYDVNHYFEDEIIMRSESGSFSVSLFLYL